MFPFCRKSSLCWRKYAWHIRFSTIRRILRALWLSSMVTRFRNGVPFLNFIRSLNRTLVSYLKRLCCPMSFLFFHLSAILFSSELMVERKCAFLEGSFPRAKLLQTDSRLVSSVLRVQFFLMYLSMISISVSRLYRSSFPYFDKECSQRFNTIMTSDFMIPDFTVRQFCFTLYTRSPKK